MWPVRNDAYEMMLNREILTDTYVLMLTELEQMINYFGLSTAIYTQTTDVEHEINGLVTYDRKVEKMDLEKMDSESPFRLSSGCLFVDVGGCDVMDGLVQRILDGMCLQGSPV